MDRPTFRKMLSIGCFNYWDYEEIMAAFSEKWSIKECIDYLVKEAEKKRKRKRV